MESLFDESRISIKAVPPLKTKSKFCFTNPSKSISALITFSTSILSAFLFADDTLVIQSICNESLLIISK